ncbi:hypothetical protein JCGZ_04460 [Jatropha curcas]|uniref:Flavanone 4-reductase n=1 Tax=Jatropha curcas TaxID=180498 RepID=A0A067L215_JATCU|nr:hypothetical protein JCGZ_04460 [Jatropha curcas]
MPEPNRNRNLNRRFAGTVLNRAETRIGPEPKNEVIKPTINGVLDILKACVKAKTVGRVVFTSSAGAVDVQETSRSMYDETCYSDLDFILAVKMTGWREAFKFAKENNLDFISIIPSLVVGPFPMPSMPPSLITFSDHQSGTESHYHIIKQGQFVHLDDLCLAHIYLFENPKAQGRFEGVEVNLQNIVFSSKKLTDLGFEFKYSLEDMFTGAVEICRAKGLLPLCHHPSV